MTLPFLTQIPQKKSFKVWSGPVDLYLGKNMTCLPCPWKIVSESAQHKHWWMASRQSPSPAGGGRWLAICDLEPWRDLPRPVTFYSKVQQTYVLSKDRTESLNLNCSAISVLNRIYFTSCYSPFLWKICVLCLSLVTSPFCHSYSILLIIVTKTQSKQKIVSELKVWNFRVATDLLFLS